ncbi:glutathione peroxidase [Bowmanella sp. Y26]|uniref:glutathione peroxidase n=1 Tax=Bowmanella yangjiangensis TaxID=2811230 RepID=UPI001BDC1444|nr:glutathione peroxidase [Bowmanella yangjiangensis]MBT1065170.1 glutathione peroxidase [Bowmanella yangjiangensis]
MTKSVYDFDMQRSNGQTQNLADYRGKVLLIVNTASQCGFTKQYAGLQHLYETFSSQGFEVLAFPCNQFGQQEPGSNAEIQSFCELNFKVSFPIFAKIDVNGPTTPPLYTHLKAQAPGIFGSQRIKWNFTKFLVNQQGDVVKRFSPTATPESIQADIQRLLASK